MSCNTNQKISKGMKEHFFNETMSWTTPGIISFIGSPEGINATVGFL